MVRYAEGIQKSLKKKLLPREVFILFNNAFLSVDLTKDLNLFDIKALKENKDSHRIIIVLGKENIELYFILRIATFS